MDENKLIDSLVIVLTDIFRVEFYNKNSSSRYHFYFESKDYDFYLPVALIYESSIDLALKKVRRWIKNHKEYLDAENCYALDIDENVTLKS
ncbi:hypothetical protein [Shewanella hafniensis]|uniref:hypothetical protein n=1 Tax=Shewanella hafniensis TaxID=365590 RepID=UPI00200F3401|nr:hypothetical protein [Shewanella hafniensis]MCL1134445.1 hypothetical protein [Shewanella hafniensis]